MKYFYLLLFACLIISNNNFAQVADPSFGNNGKLLIEDPGGIAQGNNSAKVLPDGKIVLTAGTSTPGFQVLRLNKDGSLDNSFGTGGKAAFYNAVGPSFLEIQADGKIIIIGSYGAMMRLNTDGSLDLSFNQTGFQFTALEEANAALIQLDQKIVIAGRKGTNITAIRLNTDGTFDTNFGNQGEFSIPTFNVESPSDQSPLRAMMQQSDSKLVLTGFGRNNYSLDLYIIRLNVNGTFDNTFATVGYRFLDINNGIEVPNFIKEAAPGKIVIKGGSYGDLFAVRLNDNGGLDNSFNGSGRIVIPGVSGYVEATDLQSGGQLLFAIENSIFRLTAAGATDNTFNLNGRFDVDNDGENNLPTNLLSLPDDQILITSNNTLNGISRIALTRILTVKHDFYRDSDGDGFGNPLNTVSDYFAPAGFVADNTDCNDANAVIYPGAPERCDGLDNNCNGQIDESCQLPALTISDASVYESQGIAVLTVTLSYATNRPVTLRYGTVDGTAVSIGRPTGRDFRRLANIRLSIAPGSTTANIPIAIFSDNRAETNEYFDVRLSSALNANIADNSGRVTILDGAPLSAGSKALAIPAESEISTLFSVSSYPNPSNQYFQLVVQGDPKQPAFLTVTDLLGRVVKQMRVQSQERVQFGGNWNKGIYFVQVVQGKNRKTIQLVKQ